MRTLYTGADLDLLSVSGPYAYLFQNAVREEGRLLRLPVAGGEATPVLNYPLAGVSHLIARDADILLGLLYGTNDAPQREVLRTSTLGGTHTKVGDVLYEGETMRANSVNVFVGSTLSSNYVERIGGGQTSIVIGSGLIRVGDFEVDEEFVYVNSGSDISRIPTAGGAAEIVAVAGAGDTIGELALDGDNLVFSSGASLTLAPTSAGSSQSVIDVGGSYGVMLRGTDVVYLRSVDGDPDCSQGSQLLTLSLSGGAPRLLATIDGPCIAATAIDERAVYWLAGSATERQLFRIGR